jgi:hypothetical protein
MAPLMEARQVEDTPRQVSPDQSGLEIKRKDVAKEIRDVGIVGRHLPQQKNPFSWPGLAG